MRKHIVVDRRTGKVISEESMPDDIDVETFMKQQVHDCPDCRAAIERGERPIFGSVAMPEHGGRPSTFAKRPRWRSVKNRR